MKSTNFKWPKKKLPRSTRVIIQVVLAFGALGSLLVPPAIVILLFGWATLTTDEIAMSFMFSPFTAMFYAAAGYYLARIFKINVDNIYPPEDLQIPPPMRMGPCE